MIDDCLTGLLGSGARVCRGIGCCLIVIAMMAASAVAAPADSPVNITVQEDRSGRIVLQYEIGDYDTMPVTIEGREYVHVALGAESIIKHRGEPAVPSINRSVIIPDDQEMKVRVVSSRYYDVSDVLLAPDKGYIPRSTSPTQVPYTFGETYKTDAFYPGALVTPRNPYILRSQRGLLIQLNPLQYNPVSHTLRVYTDVTLEVVKVGPGKVNVLSNRDKKETCASFEGIYRDHFLNYGPSQGASPRYSPIVEEGDMLILCNDAWMTNMQPFVAHKNSIGINTSIVGISTIPGGNTTTAIKNYIQSVYDTSDLAFVLLVGDAAQIVTPQSAGYAADPSYSLLAGSDDYPDIMLGRFSAQNSGEVDTQVERTIEYEQMPAVEQTWFWKGTGIGSNDAGVGDDGEHDWEHQRNIRADLLGYGYTEVDELYDGSQGGADATGNPSASTVEGCLNAGRGIINYTGHGSSSSWGTTSFSTADINDLVNDNMLPFIISVACNNGQFDDYGSCFGEAWLRATHNGEPTGAVVCYASSDSQPWDPPMEAQDEINLLYVAEAYLSYGAYCFAGSCSMMDEYPGSSGTWGTGPHTFYTWHIFGDPSVRITGAVETAAVKISFPEGLPEYIGPNVDNTITVLIEDGGEAYVPGSATLYCRYDGGSYQTSSLTPMGGSLYEATLPPAMCDAAPEYYISAEGSEGTIALSPEEAPTFSYTAIVGIKTVLIDDDFEMDQGWTVVNDASLTQGTWERGVPIAEPGVGYYAPLTDYDGSGQCYLTENALMADVDNGPTWLISPMVDLSASTNPVLEYARWWLNDDRDGDPLDVEISNDGGDNWILIERVMELDPEAELVEEWVARTVFISDYVTPTSEVMVRFGASDVPNNSKNEGGIDAVVIADVACSDVTCGIRGDLNEDAVVAGDDIGQFVNCFLSGDPGTEGCACADMVGFGTLDDNDIQAFIDCLITGDCP